jgi:hypothetical protein
MKLALFIAAEASVALFVSFNNLIATKRTRHHMERDLRVQCERSRQADIGVGKEERIAFPQDGIDERMSHQR